MSRIVDIIKKLMRSEEKEGRDRVFEARKDAQREIEKAASEEVMSDAKAQPAAHADTPRAPTDPSSGSQG